MHARAVACGSCYSRATANVLLRTLADESVELHLEVVRPSRGPDFAPGKAAAVDVQGFAGDEARGRRGEVDAGLRDFHRRAGALQRIGARPLQLRLGWVDVQP